ncbi:hypothetical protein [Pseudoxanthomonas sp.]|uniref:hypothetical protein n=1 Tax=Pseudoxanthomonas sp. TaxID=1871049 RepID=UPI003F7FF659
MNIAEEPAQFRELCEKVGLALLMGQKVQYALAHYYGTYQAVRNGWSFEQATNSVQEHLSRAMGNVVGAIERDAPMDAELFGKVRAFKDRRNWLAHDFDEEATPFLSRGQRIPEYIGKMEDISIAARALMQELDAVGARLVPAAG